LSESPNTEGQEPAYAGKKGLHSNNISQLTSQQKPSFQGIKHLQKYSKAPHVYALAICALRSQQLRRHVSQRSPHEELVARRLQLDRQSKVRDFEIPVSADKYVRRLYIAMYEPVLVYVFDSTKYVDGIFANFGMWQMILRLEQILQGIAAQLQNNVLVVISCKGTVAPDDVAVT
jgi:hypothetical protein